MRQPSGRHSARRALRGRHGRRYAVTRPRGAVRSVEPRRRPGDARALGKAMLKIYGRARSRAFRVIWMCCELQIPFEHLITGGDRPLPTIEDGGFVLREPSAINLYLA